MSNPVITNIPAPRVPFTDPRTGLMAREWYLFLFNLFNLTGGGNANVTIEDLAVAPDVQDTSTLPNLSQETQLAAIMSRYDQAASAIQGAYLTPSQTPQTVDNFVLPPDLGGSVTSIAQTFTGGLISIAGSPITTSGTFGWTIAGTSGGVPYFSSATEWASSAALASNQLVTGGGAGSAPGTHGNASWDGSTLAISGTLQVGTPETYTPTNVTTSRTFDADTVTVDLLADVVGTMIADLQAIGLFA